VYLTSPPLTHISPTCRLCRCTEQGASYTSSHNACSQRCWNSSRHAKESRIRTAEAEKMSRARVIRRKRKQRSLPDEQKSVKSSTPVPVKSRSEQKKSPLLRMTLHPASFRHPGISRFRPQYSLSSSSATRRDQCTHPIPVIASHHQSVT